MTYPQSGSGYGQGSYGQGEGQPQYGQQAQYGQSDQYGQAAQYGQQYGQSAQYGQAQYDPQQQAQYGYGQQQYTAPKPPSQGLPPQTGLILAATVAGLGILMLFLGFLAGYKGGDESVKLFETFFALPWALFAVAGVAAALTFIVGAGKQFVAGITALTVTSALISIFQFATKGLYDGADKGAGAIILLIFTILGAIAAVLWLLIEAGFVQVAPAAAAPAAEAAAASGAAPAAEQSAGYDYSAAYGQQASTGSSPAASPAGDYGQASTGSAYGQAYGQSASTGSASTGSAYGQQASAGSAYGQTGYSGSSEPTSYTGSNAPTSFTGSSEPTSYTGTGAPTSHSAPESADDGATTAFVKPESDTGEHKA